MPAAAVSACGCCVFTKAQAYSFPHARTPSGYREYDERDIGFVRKAVMLNRAGLALKDIALLRDCLNDEPQNFCSELRGKLADTQARIRQQIDGLHRSEQLIADLLAAEKASGGNEAV